MVEANKDIVKKRFDRTVDSYHNNAIIQKKIAEQFYDILTSLGLDDLNNILEIGCGTGFLTQQILKNNKPKKYYLNDLSFCLCNKIKQNLLKNKVLNYEYLSGDAEQIVFPNNLDAIISTSTMQWFHNINKFIEKVYRHLPNQGLFAFSTFGEQNFIEIKKTINVGLDYYSQNQLTDKLSAKFNVIYAKQWIEQLMFDSPLEILKHIKTTGVNGVGEYCWNKQKLIRFNELYEQEFRVKDKFSLTYNPIIIIAKKI